MDGFAGWRDWLRKVRQLFKELEREEQYALEAYLLRRLKAVQAQQESPWVFGGEGPTEEELKDTWEFEFSSE